MKWDELRRMRFSEEEIRQIDREAIEELVEMDLRALRESAGKTQTELALLSKLAQSELSKIRAPRRPHGLDYPALRRGSRRQARGERGLRRHPDHSPRRLSDRGGPRRSPIPGARPRAAACPISPVPLTGKPWPPLPRRAPSPWTPYPWHPPVSRFARSIRYPQGGGALCSGADLSGPLGHRPPSALRAGGIGVDHGPRSPASPSCGLQARTPTTSTSGARLP